MAEQLEIIPTLTSTFIMILKVEVSLSLPIQQHCEFLYGLFLGNLLVLCWWKRLECPYSQRYALLGLACTFLQGYSWFCTFSFSYLHPTGFVCPFFNRLKSLLVMLVISVLFGERGQSGLEQSELCPEFIVWHVTQRRGILELAFPQWGGGATSVMGCVCKSWGVPAGKQRLGILHSDALIWYDVVRCSKHCCFFSPQAKDFISSMTEKCSMIFGMKMWTLVLELVCLIIFRPLITLWAELTEMCFMMFKSTQWHSSLKIKYKCFLWRVAFNRLWGWFIMGKYLCVNLLALKHLKISSVTAKFEHKRSSFLYCPQTCFLKDSPNQGSCMVGNIKCLFCLISSQNCFLQWSWPGNE